MSLSRSKKPNSLHKPIHPDPAWVEKVDQLTEEIRLKLVSGNFDAAAKKIAQAEDFLRSISQRADPFKGLNRVQILALPLASLDMIPPRLVNSLESQHIYSVSQLLRMTREDLAAKRDIGPGSMELLIEVARVIQAQYRLAKN